MDASKLNLSSLRDKISSKLNDLKEKSLKKEKKSSKNGDRLKEKIGKPDNNLHNHKNKGHNHDKKESKKRDYKKSENDFKKTSDSVLAEDLEQDTLRKEAMALGATDEDLALIAGIEDDDGSEQEFDDVSKVDKSFNDDLSNFMKGIGLDRIQPEVVQSDEEVPELEEHHEEQEQEQEQEQESKVNEDEEEDEQADQIKDDAVMEEDENRDSSEANSDSESNSDSDSASDSDDLDSELEEDVKKPTAKHTETEEEPDKVTNVNSVVSNKLLIPNRTDWYNIPLGPIEGIEKLDRFAKDRLFERGKRIVEQENKVYLEEFAQNNSQKKFLSQVLANGTLNDKISALTLLLQEAPLHNIKALDTLMGYCDKKSRTASLQSINALKDLLLNGVLPDRKLLAFDKRDLSKTLSDTACAIYYFEDYLKKSYFKLIGILEKLSHDPIVHVKMNVLSHIFDLLKAKPEQEANLLRLGVNKIGDIDNKVASKASYQILQLQQAHPAMKKIVVDAVIDVIFKKNNEHNAQYYSITTLNQTILTRKDEELANSLVKTYFALFEKILVENDHYNVDKKEDKTLGKSEQGRKNNRKNFKKGKKGGKSIKHQDKSENEIVEEKNSKLFSALLTGLNRAFPFSNLPAETYEKHLDTLFKITHSSNFNTSIQALVLVHHIITQQKMDTDRYYRTLYESLLDPRLVTTSKQGIYLNLLFKSLKQDTNIGRISAFVKRILQICCHWLNIGSIAGMLYLLMELSKVFPQVQDLMIDFASRPDEEDEKEEKDKQDSQSQEYDPRKRDPKHANADKSSLWELNQFTHHYHPTISIYAESLLEGKTQPKPDLGLFSLSHFLDRFVYKNSKEKPVTKGSSIMQPLGGAHTGSLLVKATNIINTDIPANTENWLLKKAEDIKPDELFFHQYFTSKSSKVKNANQKNVVQKDEDEDEEGGKLDDDEIWQALVKSNPEVEDESDLDDDMSDLDEADFDDEVELDEDDEEGEAPEFEGEDVPEFDEDDASEFGEDVPGFIDDEAIEDEEEEEEDGEEEEEEEEGDNFEDESIFGINHEDEVSDDEIVEEDEETLSASTKKRSKTSKKTSKKLKSLPVFASAEDYSKYLDSDDENL